MLPIILVSNSKKNTKSFISGFVKQNGIKAENVLEIFPLKSEIVISQVRDVRRSMSIAFPEMRIYVFYEFDKATNEGQNALLKKLEESGNKNQLIMVTSNEYVLLPTIRSRSKIVRLENENKIPEEKFTRIAKILGKIEEKKDFSFLTELDSSGTDKLDLAEFFLSVILYYRAKLESEPKAFKIIKKTLEIKTLCERNNLNVQLARDQLLIFIHKLFRMS